MSEPIASILNETQEWSVGVVIRCPCRREVWCQGMTTYCECGHAYNWAGQRLNVSRFTDDERMEAQAEYDSIWYQP